MMTENHESVQFIMRMIARAVYQQCETKSDWLTHLLDPQMRKAAADFAVALAQAIGC